MISDYKKLFLIFLLTSAVGCAGGVSGKVYLDKNDNNVKDDDEPGIGRVLYDINLDGNSYGSGITSDSKDDVGSFSFKPDKKGYYCVSLKSVSTSYSTTPPVVEKLGKALVDQSGQQTITTQTTDQTTTETTETKPTETEKPVEPVKPDTTQSLKSCFSSTGSYHSKITLDVPVARQYEQSLTQLPAQDVFEGSPGDTAKRMIYYPCSCKPMNLSLPTNLSVSKKKPYGKTAGVLDVSSALLGASLVNLPYYNITNDAICQIEVELLLGEEPESGEVETNQKAICPNNQELALPTLTFKWKTPKITFVQDIKNADGTTLKDSNFWGKELALEVSVKNYRSAKTGDDAAANLIIKLPKYAAATKIDEDKSCKNQVQQVTCSVNPNEDDKTFSINFKYPEYNSLYFTETGLAFSIETSLETPESKDIIKADSIPLNASPPPPNN